MAGGKNQLPSCPLKLNVSVSTQENEKKKKYNLESIVQEAGMVVPETQVSEKQLPVNGQPEFPRRVFAGQLFRVWSW